jgi:hypothetical protein
VDMEAEQQRFDEACVTYQVSQLQCAANDFDAARTTGQPTGLSSTFGPTEKPPKTSPSKVHKNRTSQCERC